LYIFKAILGFKYNINTLHCWQIWHKYIALLANLAELAYWAELANWAKLADWAGKANWAELEVVTGRKCTSCLKCHFNILLMMKFQAHDEISSAVGL
jgi:hypothetical protein